MEELGKEARLMDAAWREKLKESAPTIIKFFAGIVNGESDSNNEESDIGHTDSEPSGQFSAHEKDESILEDEKSDSEIEESNSGDDKFVTEHREADAEDVGRISTLLNHLLRISSLEEVDDDSWTLLYRASKFLTKLKDRFNVLDGFELDVELLGQISDTILRPLEQKVAQQPRYAYSPLVVTELSDTHEIRVLHLLNQPGEEPRCRLEHRPLNEASFSALSYEWGDSKRLFCMNVVDDSGVSVGTIPLTDKLHTALDDLCRASQVPVKTFWIDQISINQDDRSERSSQVNFMGKIYTQAEGVISYLGPGEPGDVEGYKCLEYIKTQYPQHLDELTRIVLEEEKRFHHDVQSIPENLHFKGEFTVTEFQFLKRLVYGPWSRRLWMIQETVLNEKNGVLMLRGERCFSFDIIECVAQLHFSGILPSWRTLPRVKHFDARETVVRSCVSQHMSRIRRLDSPDSEWQELFDASFWVALTELSHSVECYDARDRIYGLLGLSEDAEKLGIIADYTKSYEDVLLDVNWRLLANEKIRRARSGQNPFMFWSSANLETTVAEAEKARGALPSWVCRFPPMDTTPFSLSNPDPPNWDGMIEFSEDRKRLIVPGIAIAHIAQVVASFKTKANNVKYAAHQDFESLRTVLETMRSKLPRADTNNGSGADADDVILRTIWAKSIPELVEGVSSAEAIEILLRMSDMGLALEVDEDGEVDQDELIPRLEKQDQELAVFFWEWAVLRLQSVCITDTGLFCVATDCVREGDVVVMLRGMPYLHALRQVGDDYLHIGPAYMDDFMEDEAREKPGWEESVQTFSII